VWGDIQFALTQFVHLENVDDEKEQEISARALALTNTENGNTL